MPRLSCGTEENGNWSSFQLANSAPPLSVTGSAIAPSARMTEAFDIYHETRNQRIVDRQQSNFPRRKPSLGTLEDASPKISTSQSGVYLIVVGGSAITPASAARNCAVDRRIAEPVGVTDVGVQ